MASSSGIMRIALTMSEANTVDLLSSGRVNTIGKSTIVGVMPSGV